MKLLAILLAFALFRFVKKPKAMKSFEWLNNLRLWVKGWTHSAEVQILMTVSFPLILLFLLVYQVLSFGTDSLAYLLLQTMVVFYCLGPSNMEDLVGDNNSRKSMGLSDDATPKQIIDKLTDAALHRWFGVFFWYLVAGVLGALLFRLLCSFQAFDLTPEEQRKVNFTLKILEFPVTVLMTLALALASDFDRIWKHCKQYINAETIKQLNSQYMYESMDFAVEQCEIEKNDENKDHIIEITTYTVLNRMLVVWLVFTALLVIFSIG